MGRIIKISDNDIKAVNFGIGVQNSAPLKLLIDSNSIDIDAGGSVAGQAIRLDQVTHNSQFPPIEVKNNIINLFGVFRGINLNSCQEIQVVNNTVTQNEFVNEYELLTVDGSIHCDFYDNNLTGFPSSKGNNSLGIGIDVFNGYENNYCCNRILHINKGMNFLGTCNYSDLAGTTFGGQQEVGLNIQSGTIIGVQDKRGNLWPGIYSSGFGAIHESLDLIEVFQSRFIVNVNATGGAPLLPYFSSVYSDWFSAESFGKSHDCLKAPECGNLLQLNLKIQSEDIYIAKGLPKSFRPAVRWHMERSLFDKLEKHPELLGLNSIIDIFYQEKVNSNINNFNQVEKEIASIFEMDLSYQNSINEDYTQLEDLLKNIHLKNNQIEKANSSNRDGLKKEKNILFSKLIKTTDSLNSQLKQTGNKYKESAAVLQSINSQLEAKAVFEENEKIVNDIIILSIISGEILLDNSQIATLKRIANQCPLDGGNAVFKARGLLYRLTNIVYDDKNICKEIQSNQSISKVKNEKREINIFPNPATEEININFKTSIEGEISLTILNIFGKTIISRELKSTLDTLDISSLNAGVYFVRISDGNQFNYVEKIIVLD